MGRRLLSRGGTGTQTRTEHVEYGAAAEAVVDGALGQAYGNWHVETTAETVQLRVTKKGEAQVHRSAADPGAGHEPRPRLADAARSRRPAVRRARVRRRQAPSGRGVPAGARPCPRRGRGCPPQGRPAASGRPRVRQRRSDAGDVCPPHPQPWLGRRTSRGSTPRPRPASTTRRSRLSSAGRSTTEFVQGRIGEVSLAESPDIVLALHACDTATDEALARAIRWQAPLVLAAPCCHHDIQRQLAAAGGVDCGAASRTGRWCVRGFCANASLTSSRTRCERPCFACTATASTSWSSWRPSTRLATLCSVRCGPVRRQRQSWSRSTDALTASWHVRPALEVLLDGVPGAAG